MKANNKKDIKEAYIRCRVDKQTRDNFNLVCEKLKMNGSEWLRNQIYKLIAMNK